jgi:signal transduction histidine kinase
MSRLLPRSLFGQTLLVLLIGLVVSHIAGSWIYSQDRLQAMRAVGGIAVAQRIANLTKLVQESSGESRARIVAALSDQSFHVSISPDPAIDAASDEDVQVTEVIKNALIDQLSLGATQQPQVFTARPVRRMFGIGPPMRGYGPMMHDHVGFGPFAGFRDLQVAIPLTDGDWLTFAAGLPQGGPSFSRQFPISMAVMAVIILAVSIWVVRRVTAPLAALSSAAERLGGDLNAPPMPETGTIETRQASRAFNTMQARLRVLIETRTRLLAAVSHDLRTPLTLLRLRIENVEDPAERDKMLSTIAEMESMIAATLQFARDEATAEAFRRTDLTALLDSVVDDMADAGIPVTMEPAEPAIRNCQPAALKRALTNLIDNAVKYGDRARTAIRTTPQAVEITIDDDGPGIPQNELARVVEPFYRVEASRSRDTGGIGLGLAIALSLVQGNKGSLTLSNRPEGGLRACINLPA